MNMNKMTSNKEILLNKPLNKPNNMKKDRNLPPQFDKNSPHYDNTTDTTDDYIIDEENKNNQLARVCGPFNFNYTNYTSGNIYGNVSLNNINLSPVPNTKEGKESNFYKEVFNNLLAQYTNITQTLMNNNFQKREIKEIKNNEMLKVEVILQKIEIKNNFII